MKPGERFRRSWEVGKRGEKKEDKGSKKGMRARKMQRILL